MSADDDVKEAARIIAEEVEKEYRGFRDQLREAANRYFTKVMAAEWLFAIVMAALFSPYGWEGKERVIGFHVWLAIGLGGAILGFPIFLTITRPGALATRYFVAFAQMLYSALLIHLSGGRIETHFAVFVLLGLLGRYLDIGVLLTATVTVALDHLVRGVLYPESVYGITNPEWWRFLEHAFYVVVSMIFNASSGIQQLAGWRKAAEKKAEFMAHAEGEWRKQSVADRGRKQMSGDAHAGPR